MLKGWMHDIALAVQAKSGATPAVFVWIAVLAIALLTAFVFLCVAAYMWLSLQFGGVVAGLIMAGVFALIAAIAAIICSLARRHARERAILERAARGHAPSWLLDPKILATALQVGRSVGWQRIVPVALFGFIAAQWVREYRAREGDNQQS
jgi:hypothetical protein